MTWLQAEGKQFDKTAITPQSNVSLVFAKFGAAWPLNDKAKEMFIDIVKQALDGGVTCLPESSADRTLYEDALERRLGLVNARGGKPYSFNAATEWRFVTGMGIKSPLESGIELHPVHGVPYLPSTGVKGLTRHFAEHWLDPKPNEQTIGRLFGPRLKSGEAGGNAGSVIFFDALPAPDVALELDVMTPHYGDWYQKGEAPGDWMSPNPVLFFTVPAKTKFHFALAPRHRLDNQCRKDAAKAAKWLKQALKWLGAGAKTKTGYGRFKVP